VCVKLQSLTRNCHQGVASKNNPPLTLVGPVSPTWTSDSTSGSSSSLAKSNVGTGGNLAWTNNGWALWAQLHHAFLSPDSPNPAPRLQNPHRPPTKQQNFVRLAYCPITFGENAKGNRCARWSSSSSSIQWTSPLVGRTAGATNTIADQVCLVRRRCCSIAHTNDIKTRRLVSAAVPVSVVCTLAPHAAAHTLPS
jgi:hypothetical protein